MRILLISLDTEEGRRLHSLLSGAVEQRLEVQLLSDIDRTRQVLSSNACELIVFDLHRGEEDLPALAAVLNRSVGLSVLVLVASEHRKFAARAMKMGAEQYLFKEQLCADLLFCVCQRAVRRVGQHEGAPDSSRDVDFFQQAGETRKRFPAGSAEEDPFAREKRLSLRQEEEFRQFVRRFGDALELALERMMYKVEINISGTLELMAEELGRMNASPRDLVEVYTSCLEAKRRRSNEQRYKAYVDEGRLLLIETMGYLVNFYRRVAWAGKINDD